LVNHQGFIKASSTALSGNLPSRFEKGRDAVERHGRQKWREKAADALIRFGGFFRFCSLTTSSQQGSFTGMKRRNLLTSASALALLSSLPALAGSETKSSTKRTVFKLPGLEHRLGLPVVVRESDALDIAEFKRGLELAFKEAETDPHSLVLMPETAVYKKSKARHIDVADMERCPFSELRAGDCFVLYESSGELVTFTSKDGSTGCVMRCINDAYVDDDGGDCVAVDDIHGDFGVPRSCP
jgi:hypothetical protein